MLQILKSAVIRIHCTRFQKWFWFWHIYWLFFFFRPLQSIPTGSPSPPAPLRCSSLVLLLMWYFSPFHPRSNLASENCTPNPLPHHSCPLRFPVWVAAITHALSLLCDLGHQKSPLLSWRRPLYPSQRRRPLQSRVPHPTPEGGGQSQLAKKKKNCDKNT